MDVIHPWVVFTYREGRESRRGGRGREGEEGEGSFV